MSRAAFYAELRPVLGPLTQVQVDGINAILDEVGVDYAPPLQHLAYMLATAWHETAYKMQPIHERGGRRYFDKYEPGTRIGHALGNVVKGDGYLFRGRGFVQLTGRANYKKAGRKLGVDLLREPDMALLPENATKIMAIGMTEGWFTGKKLSDYIGPNGADYKNARRIINGTDKAVKIAGYAATFEKALRAAGY